MDPPPPQKKNPPHDALLPDEYLKLSKPSSPSLHTPPPPFIQPLYNDAFTIYQFNKYMIDFRVQVRSLCQKKSMICDQKYRNSLYRGLINKAS